MVVVDQPERRRACLALTGGDRRDGAIGGQQERRVVRQAPGQGETPAAARRDRLRRGEAAAMVFEALDAEQLGTDPRTVPQDRRRRRGAEQAAETHRRADGGVNA